MRRIIVVPLAALVMACASHAPPATDPPPAAPTIQMGDWTTSIIHWTVSASVNPRGAPTEVVLQWGFGAWTSPSLDTVVPVERGILVAGVVTKELSLTPDRAFCVRFIARNVVGSASTETSCHGLEPSIVLPAAMDSPGTSVAP